VLLVLEAWILVLVLEGRVLDISMTFGVSDRLKSIVKRRIWGWVKG